ncbi:DgyrCDS9979 [Dimorphilus gyrociliatus]|uniref:DgyrCDS9979 n=1 Tax=Dimorphilus gyrociliatus TaxID=2664684 RepID=A0A7I8W0W6_9ANNE|nr:DgyrCDS9979 [Dimorphilus gyrociliatus]
MDRVFKLQLNCRIKVKLQKVLYHLQRTLMEFADILLTLQVGNQHLIEVNDILLEVWMPALPIVGRVSIYRSDDYEVTKELDILANVDRLIAWIIERLLTNDINLKEKNQLSLILIKLWRIILKFVDRLESIELLSIRKRELDTILLSHWKTISNFVSRVTVLELDSSDMAELHKILFCLRKIISCEMDKVELIELTKYQRGEVQKILLYLRWIASWLAWTLSGFQYKDPSDKQVIDNTLDFFSKIVSWLAEHEPILERTLYNKRELQTVLLILQHKVSHVMDILPKLKIKRKKKINKSLLNVWETVYNLVDEIPIFKLKTLRVERIRLETNTKLYIKN